MNVLIQLKKIPGERGEEVKEGERRGELKNKCHSLQLLHSTERMWRKTQASVCPDVK